MTKNLDQIIKQYTTPKQRQALRKLSNKSKAALGKTIIGKTLKDAKHFYTSDVKPLIEASQSQNKKSSTSSIANKPATLSAAPKGSVFKGDVTKLLLDVGRTDERGAKARQDLIMFLISAGAPSPEAEAFGKALSTLSKTKGAQSAVTLAKSVVSKAKSTPKLISKTVKDATVSAKNQVIRSNPKAAETINKGVQRFKATQKDFNEALDAILVPKTGTKGIVTKDIPMDQSAAAELRAKGFQQQLDKAAMRDGRVQNPIVKSEPQIATPDEFMNLGGSENPSLINAGDSSKNLEALKAQSSRIASRAEELRISNSDEESKLLEFLKSVGEENSVGKDLNKINKTVDKVNKSGFDSLSEDEAKSFTDSVKENAEELGKMAKECGVSSKKDLPGFIKFIKDTYNLISNAPNSIKGAGLIAGGLAGLTIYDFYRSYKENGDSFAGLKTPMGRVIRHVLGYDGRDKLSKAAAKKAGLVDKMTEKQQRDADLGLFSQDLIDSEVPEFFSGASGRKYHNLNGYIYDFSTGRPVDLNTAINDFTQLLQYQDQQIVDKTNVINQQIADLQALAQQGYQIPQEQIQTLETQRDLLQSQQKETKQQLKALTSPSYDPNGDLTQQYKMNVVDPQQLQQQAQYAQINQNRLAYDEMYKKGYETIAQNTWDNLDKYYTPEQANVDYYEYSAKVAKGQAPYMDVQSFYNMQKMKMMREAAPQIAQQAATFAQNYATAQKYTVDQDLTATDINRKRDKDIADINQAYLNYQEDMRHNRVGEQISFGEYLVKKGQLGVQQANAETNRMNAFTNRGELGIKEYNAKTGRLNAEANTARAKAYVEESPYRQFADMGTGFTGGAMGNVEPDTMINLNPNLGKKIAPKAFEQQATPQQPQANQPSLIDKALGLFRGN